MWSSQVPDATRRCKGSFAPPVTPGSGKAKSQRTHPYKVGNSWLESPFKSVGRMTSYREQAKGMEGTQSMKSVSTHRPRCCLRMQKGLALQRSASPGSSTCHSVRSEPVPPSLPSQNQSLQPIQKGTWTRPPKASFSFYPKKSQCLLLEETINCTNMSVCHYPWVLILRNDLDSDFH